MYVQWLWVLLRTMTALKFNHNQWYIHCACPPKVDHSLMAITLLKPNRSFILERDDDKIAYFTVRWKTRKLVLSTAPINCKQNPYSTTPKVQICDKLHTNVMFDETKYILSHDSADNAIVKLTTVARNARLLPVDTLWFMPCQTSSKRFFSSSMLCSRDWCTRCWTSPHIL